MGVEEDILRRSIERHVLSRVPGLTPERPLQEQHPDIGAGTRFAIMTAGGGGEAGARRLEELGLEVKHLGGMNFSVRKPGEQWRVMDPSTLEFQDISDLFGDVLSVGGMTAGALAATPGGFPGMMAGAAAGGALTQAGRAALGGMVGIEPTGTELLKDVAVEAGIGAGAEVLGAVAAPIARAVFPKRLTIEARQIEHAIPKVSTPEMRSYWEIAGMPETKVMQEWLPGEKVPKVLFEEGRVIPADPKKQLAGQVLGYEQRDLVEKLAHEYFPTVREGIDQMARQAGKPRSVLAAEIITQDLPQTGYMKRLYGEINWELTEPEVFDQLASVAARGMMGRSQRRDLTRKLARIWRLEPEGLTDRELARLVRRRMADDDFVFREAARKMGVKGAFDPEANLEQLLAQTYKFEQARAAIATSTQGLPKPTMEEIQQAIATGVPLRGAGTTAGAAIEAGFRGGPPRQFLPRPPYAIEEARRAQELAPFIRGERYRGEGPQIRGRGPLARPAAAEEEVMLTREAMDIDAAERAAMGLPPMTRKEVQEYLERTVFPEGRRTKAHVRVEKLRQEQDIANREYYRRVYGQVPEMLQGKTVGGQPPYIGPLVDVEARSRQIMERAAGEPWERMGAKYGYRGPGVAPRAPAGFVTRRGAAAGGPTGGVVPRAEAVDFWRWLSLEDLTSLRVGGREIPLTAPQSEMVKETLYVLAVSPGAKRVNKAVNFLAGTLQLPRTVLRTVMKAMSINRGASFLDRQRGAFGALTGGFVYPGGITGALVGAGAELLGRGAARFARQLIREPNEDLLRDLIRKAVRREGRPVARKLQQAATALRDFGPTAFRAMIYEAMHHPGVRRVFELEAVDQE